MPAITLRPGDPIGHYLGPTGTLGLKVKRIGDNALLLLSCSHVLARCGFATQGETIKMAAQPDSFSLTIPIGQLDIFTTLSAQTQNNRDFALASLDPGVSVQAEIPGIGVPTSASSVPAISFNAYQNFEVKRLGADLKLQPGIVQGYTGPVYVQDLPVFGQTLVEYDNVVAYATQCDHGDSGAAVVSVATGEVFGIHVGGDPARNIGYFCPVGEFLNQFGLELCHD